MKECPHKNLVSEVASLLHSDQPFDAARAFLKGVNLKADNVDSSAKAYEVLTQFLHWLLAEDFHTEAASLLWPSNFFTPEPEATRRVWSAFDNQNYILLMGAASMSKSYSMGARLLLEWIADPEQTSVQVLGPSENHLEDNLFTHLVTLHKESAIPLPGLTLKLFIGINPKARKGAIRGVVVPIGKKAAGRIQGTKRVQRKKRHPKYGNLTRLFIFLDEIANIPKGIWKDIDNVLSNNQGDCWCKIIGAFNPTDPNDEVGKRCEPPFGWASFDPDKHFEWMSTRDWWVVRLDAKYSENVKLGYKKFEGLQTLEGFNKIIKNSGGLDSPGYWTMCRGCFPPLGVVMSLIPSGMLNKFKGEFIWYDTPQDCAGVDLALTGRDTAIFAKGRFGLASGIKLPPSLEHPNGITVWFKNDKGAVLPRYALQLEAMFPFPKGETITMANAVITLCKQTHVKPGWLCIDKTGNGQGVYDTIRNIWSQAIHGLNFSEACTKEKILQEDSQTPEELYDRVQTELWFAMRGWIEYDYVKGLFSLETSELFSQLSQRHYRATGKRSKIESKEEYESRNQCKSPDMADAFSLLIHGVRLESAIKLGTTPSSTTADGYGDSDDGEDTQRVDCTNRVQELD